MQRHEIELETAGEVTDHQQDERAMRERFEQRLPIILLEDRRGARFCRGVLPRRRDRERQRYDQEQNAGENFQRGTPADLVDQADAERREQELTERSRRSAGAERDRTPALRQQLAER